MLNVPCQPPPALERALVIAGLLLAAVLAGIPLIGDSITFDETLHLTAGYSHLTRNDFRLAPETPPLAQMGSALPLLFMNVQWVPTDLPAWQRSDVWQTGRAWFALHDADRLVMAARGMTLILLLLTCYLVYRVARRMFGAWAGLLALALAALDPGMLAHGHLVTTDMAATLCFLLVLLTCARLLERWTGWRLVALTLSFAALLLVKYSWPFVVPALALMGILVLRRSKARVSASSVADAAPQPTDRINRTRVLTTVAALLLGTWGLIWLSYGARFSPFKGPGAEHARFSGVFVPDRPEPSTHAEAWESVLAPASGQAPDLLARIIRHARDHRLLPEAYLYGLAYTRQFGRQQSSYFLGTVTSGQLAYFPVALAVKTPSMHLLLMLGGTLALLLRRDLRQRGGALLAGLAAFAAVYLAAAMLMRFNIGHRHLLPIYPVLFIVAGATTLAAHRPLRALVAVLLLGTGVTTIGQCPHYLGYFNLPSGGPNSGFTYLADSNIDWGQDLKRLRTYLESRGHPPIKLAWFGSIDPKSYALDCTALPSFQPFDPPAELTPGTYVASLNQMLGLYYPPARPQFWTDRRELYYRRLDARVRELRAKSTALTTEEHDFIAELNELRGARLLWKLRARVQNPDDRIGRSLLVFDLSQPELDEMLAP